MLESIQALDTVWAGVGDRMHAKGPLSKEYGQAVSSAVSAVQRNLRAAVPAEAPAKPCSDETGQTPSITKPGTCARCGAVLGQYSICDECPAEADTTEECMTCDGKGRDCGETCIGCAGSGRRCSGCLNASAYCSCDDPDPAAPPTTTKDGNK